MAGNEKQQITRETIGSICERFGFVYHPAADGHDSVKIGDDTIEITFKEDGTLPRGRNRFLTAARKASAGFAEFCPASKKSPSAKSGKGKPPTDSLPKLNKAFLMKYTEEALEGLQRLLPDILAKKEEEKKSMEKISVLEEVIANLKAALEAVKATGFPPPEGMKEKLAESEMELADLRKPRG